MNKDKARDSQGLFIPSRRLSALASGMIFGAFFVFMGGYFIGKNAVLEPFIAKMEEASLADQVYTSMYARYEDNIGVMAEAYEEPPSVKEQKEESSPNTMQLTESNMALPQWYAQLIGYAKEPPAVNFAKKLEKKGLPVKISKRFSATVNGKKRYWYQVITEPYFDRQALQKVVDQIAYEEKIKDIKIVDALKA